MTPSRPSLRRHLLMMLVSSIVLIWLVVVFLVYRAAAIEVEEVFDRDLVRVSRILQSLLLHEVEEETEMGQRARAMIAELGSEIARFPGLAAALAEYAEDPVQERLELVELAERTRYRHGRGLTFIVRHGDGSVMMRDREAPDVPLTADGFTNLRTRGVVWRVFTLADERTGLMVQAGELLASRADLAREITRNTLAPMLFALPPIGLLIWLVVGRALAPLRHITQELSRRAPDSLEAIDDRRSPQEIDVLLRALNTLFGRLRSAIRRERQFTADAAHELRTPLAALKTNLQVAQLQARDAATRESLAAALASVDRASHSVAQLLSLARVDAEGDGALKQGAVDLRELAGWAVAEFHERALGRGVDLGIGDSAPVTVRGDSVALQMLLSNLVDNAVRYTPSDGTVTVNVGSCDGAGWIEVLDDKPGVAAEERERIFDRFHRGPVERAASGSGLGLSIVQRIARLHGAGIKLGEGLNGRGLGVRIRFPASGADDWSNPSEDTSRGGFVPG